MWIFEVLFIGVILTLLVEGVVAIFCRVSKGDLKIVALADILVNYVEKVK